MIYPKIEDDILNNIEVLREVIDFLFEKIALF